VQHTGRRHLKSKDTITFAFLVGDVLFTGMTIGLFSIISRTGVPSNCAGLTRSDCKYNRLGYHHIASKLSDALDEADDAPNDPRQGYETIRFGSGGDRGELDHFCSIERAYYFITIAIM
jgi:hypothetical protein